MAPSTSALNTFLLLFYVLSTFLHISSHKLKCIDGPGNNGRDCKCESNHFLQYRQGTPSCQRCTRNCNSHENQIEVVPCSYKQNRKCVCKPGFYCKEDNNYVTYCHSRCNPCEAGTFSSKPSLSKSCMPHKDCAKLGMIVLREGTATQDRDCVSDTTMMPSTASIAVNTNSSDTIPTTSTDTITSGSSDTITSGSSDIITSGSSDIITSGSSDAITSGSSDIITSGSSDIITSGSSDTITPWSSSTSRFSRSITTGFSNVTTSGSAKIPAAISSDTTSTPGTSNSKGVTPSKRFTKESQSLWLLLLILFIFMAGFCVLTKGKAGKTISKCFGFVCEKHKGVTDPCKQSAGHPVLSNHSSETEMPLGSDAREVKGQNLGTTPSSGGVQHLKMNNRNGENVSNTVGSIYIYSPGTVILGSNSGEKNERAGACEEDVPLIGKPQQESNPPSEVRIRMSTQEEAKEEHSLRFPVPATGK